jgi:error-prone DNA polymerase
VYFLLVEDEWGLLQATIFEGVYTRYGHLLHREGAFLLDGVVEHTADNGFSFLVHRVESLLEVLTRTAMPIPRMATSSGAFLRAERKGWRTG